jgi:filamentous hemagglutinin family protein
MQVGIDARTFAGMLAILLSMPCAALPTGGGVSAGRANIQSSAGRMLVQQSSPSASINWQTFSIGSGEVVQFLQPDVHSVVLNRVIGLEPSAIYGSLSSNGKVFLINPAGILFARGAAINVGSLVASALNLTDRQMLENSPQFSGAGKGPASVINEGVIRTNADGGFVALLGANVRNDGTIVARLGTVALAAGEALTLDLVGDTLLNVKVDRGAFAAQVGNGGLIFADGGQVLLTAQGAGALLQTVVNQTGMIQANTIENHAGVIRLLADMQSGSVVVDGTLLAQGDAAGGDGGFIETSAARVSIADSARVNTLAPLGRAGTWLVDPTDFTIADVAGNISAATLVTNLAAGNVSISSNNGSSGAGGDIFVNSAVQWAAATTLTLDAVHDVNVNASITADTAGAGITLLAGHDVATSQPITVVAAGSAISIQGANNVTIGGALNAVAAGSTIHVAALNDLSMGGAITATAANSTVSLDAGRDVLVSAAIIAVAADSLIKITAARDITTSATAAIGASAATTLIELDAGRNIAVNSAIAAGAAGSGIKLLSGLSGTGPGAANGTVSLAAAVAAPLVSIRFNPVSYASTAAEIASYPALSDARAWVYAKGNSKVYDATIAASLSLVGNPLDGGAVSLTGASAAFANKQAGLGKAISYTGYGLAGADASRFALFTASGTTSADITPRPLNVVAAAGNRVYDGTRVEAVTLSDDRIAGDLLTLSYGGAAFADKNVGNGKAVAVVGISASGADALNYTANAAFTAAANITPAALTVTAANAQKTYGQTPVLSAFATLGLVSGETIGSVTENSSGTLAGAGVASGPYAITASNAAGGTFSAANYTIVYHNGALTVVPAPMLVTAASDTKFFGQTDNVTAFTVSGLVNGDTVAAFTQFSPGAPASASLAGSPYPIRLSQASGGTFVASNYNISYVDGTLTVLPPAAANLPTTVVLPRPGNVPAGVVPIVTAGLSAPTAPASLLPLVPTGRRPILGALPTADASEPALASPELADGSLEEADK